MPNTIFQPQGGMQLDESPTAAEGGWTDGDKIRFRAGRPELIGGWESATLSKVSGVCRTVHTWADLNGAPLMAFGTHSHLMALSGGAMVDITPPAVTAGLVDGIGGAGFGTGTFGTGVFGVNNSASVEFWPRTWSLDHFGQNLVAAPRNGGIYQWGLDITLDAVAVTNAPARVGSIFTTPERIVAAVGSNDVTATWNPMMVRWCDQENLTAWQPTAANQAGDFVLARGSRAVAGRVAGKVSLIWTDVGVYSMRYLGDPLLVYGFEYLGDGGLAGPNACAVMNGVAFWLSPAGTFHLFDGQQPQEVPCPVRRHITDNISWVQADKVVISTIEASGEFIILYPDKRDGNEVSRYALFNPKDGTWSVGTLDRTAWTDAGPQTWPVAVTSAGTVYYHEKGRSADGGPIAWRLESAPVDLADGDALMAVLRVIPDFEELAGGVTVELLAREWPQASPVTRNLGTISSQSGKLDCRVTARHLALRLSGASAPAFWRLGAVRFDTRETGAKR